jgi:Mn2+/Fe2+ NRAMP family transporter
MVISIIGTTIAPWMQFYMQSSVIEKGITLKEYKYTVIDVLVGCVATVVVAFFIMVACSSTLYSAGKPVVINEARDVALALKPLAGALAMQIFGFGLFIAAIFSATILPVATAFYVCEAFGFDAGIDKKWEEAPQFYWLYTIIMALGAGIVLLPGIPLITVSIASQTINGILLPVVLICMMVIVNKKEVMGDYVNKPVVNVIGWAAIAVLVMLSLSMLLFTFL